MASTNGKTVHVDMGADRDTREPKPCARRFASDRWCTRPDSHAGDCDGPAAHAYEGPNYMPLGCR